jgi:hypothetical protein
MPMRTTEARHFDRQERQRRLLVRHHLARPGTSVEQVAGDLVGLHSTDPATVVLSARARLEPFAVADLEDALYERRTLLRMLAMRRTMFVVPRDLADVMQAACTRTLVPVERRRLVAMLDEAGVVDHSEGIDDWLRRVEAATLAALREHGPMTASELATVVPELALQLRLAAGKRYEGVVGVSTRVLFLLAAQGLIARGRPLGSWLSTQYRWAAMTDWFGVLPALPERAARAELARRWLQAFGPGTGDDLAWWAKWTKTDVKAALAEIGAVPVTVDTGDGAAAPAWVLPDDLADTPVDAASPNGAPPVALLPALDPTIMGWKGRAWYLGPHRGALFDRTGNAGPTVWVGGQAVGAWGQRPDGEVVTRLLEDLGAGEALRVEEAARSLTEWLAGVRVTPRFPTPLHRDLATS